MSDDVHAALAEHPFVRHLGTGELDRLRPLATLVHWSPRAYVFREGEPADRFFLVRSGRVALEQDVPGRGVTQVESLGPGDVLGLSWLVAGATWTLDAEVVEAGDAIALDAASLRESMAKDAVLGRALATELVHQLYRRLERVRLQRLDVYKDDA